MNNITTVEKEKAGKRTMQEMNEQYKDCPVQVNEYEVDGRRYRVTSHFIGDRDIKKVLPLPIYCAIMSISVKAALERKELR